MHALQRTLRRAVGLASVCLVVAAGGLAEATTVRPIGLGYEATSNGAVTFTISSSPLRFITCESAFFTNVIPNEQTNPNENGSVITDIPTTESSGVSGFRECSLEEIPLSGGGAGPVSFAWNSIGSGMFVAASFAGPAFLWSESGGCHITIGNAEVQSMIGLWTNGRSESQLVFTEQSLAAIENGSCGFPAFTRVLFEGTFDVLSPAGRAPVTVE